MNYLAHFHLAKSDPLLIAGALLGDYVKGPLQGAYPQAVERGIALHRNIDAFTDEYALTQQLHALFPAEFRRVSGIMLDLYFDHVLARCWRQHEELLLDEFSEIVVSALRQSEHLLPPAALAFSRRLQQYSLLSRYAEPETIDRSLQHLATRLRAPNPLARAMPHLTAKHVELEQIFEQFYPLVQQHVRSALNNKVVKQHI